MQETKGGTKTSREAVAVIQVGGPRLRPAVHGGSYGGFDIF